MTTPATTDRVTREQILQIAEASARYLKICLPSDWQSAGEVLDLEDRAAIDVIDGLVAWLTPLRSAN